MADVSLPPPAPRNQEDVIHAVRDCGCIQEIYGRANGATSAAEVLQQVNIIDSEWVEEFCKHSRSVKIGAPIFPFHPKQQKPERPAKMPASTNSPVSGMSLAAREIKKNGSSSFEEAALKEASVTIAQGRKRRGEESWTARAKQKKQLCKLLRKGGKQPQFELKRSKSGCSFCSRTEAAKLQKQKLKQKLLAAEIEEAAAQAAEPEEAAAKLSSSFSRKIPKQQQIEKGESHELQ
ncbi:hypothetical protein M9H77_11880 [Catharanthus roseus]|uniref:Uncharacterized protein n=1 Tax=Catharanthus roseus TaxID=4058 RepID=A0ACC0BFX7_CATRO|nr:hypothetical protein M9H77_11880 [Catharanthus roseus]